MLNDIIVALTQYGLPVVVCAVLIYLLLRGEIDFHYPGKRK